MTVILRLLRSLFRAGAGRGAGKDVSGADPDFRTVEPFGFLALEVPRKWQLRGASPEHESYADEDDPLITELSLAYMVMFWAPSPAVDRDVQRYWRATGPDEPERLQWMVRENGRDCVMLILIDLFLERGLGDRPEYQYLIERLDRAIRQKRIGRPPHDAPTMMSMADRSDIDEVQ